MTLKNIQALKDKANHIVIKFSNDGIEKIITDESEELIVFLPFALAFQGVDQRFIEKTCLKLARHPNEHIRGNAILAFGHLASRFEEIFSDEVYDIVKNALNDESEYVRGQATSAINDLTDFVGWKF